MDKKLTEDEKNALASILTDDFFQSQKLSEAIADLIMETQPPPMQVAFAFEVVHEFMGAQVPDWEKCREFARKSMIDFRKNGVIPELGRVGDTITVVKPGRGR